MLVTQAASYIIQFLAEADVSIEEEKKMLVRWDMYKFRFV